MNLARFACGVAMLLLSGCAGSFMQTIQISSMAQKKQHHEIIRTLQPQLDQQKTLPAFHLFLLSGAYYEVRDYQHCLATVRLLQSRIDHGETSYLGGNLTPYPQILQGYVHLDQGEYAQAVRFATKAYELIDTPAGRGNFFFRSQMIQIAEIAGVAQALQNNTVEAKRWLGILHGIPIDSSILGPEKYTAIARINMALKNYREALAAIRDPQAKVTGLTTAFYDQTFQELPRYFIETKALFEIGEREQAKQGYDQLLKHPQIREIGGMYWQALLDRARIASSEGDAALAERLLREAVDVVEVQRSSIATEAGRIGFVGDKQAIYQELVNLLLTSGRIEQAFEYAERAKSRALVDLLASSGSMAIKAGAAGATFDKMVRAEQDVTVIADAGTPAPSTRGLIVALKRQLTQEAPEFASLVSVTSPKVQEIQRCLDRDETLLEYYGSGHEWYVFAITRAGVGGKRIPLPDIAAKVQAFREQLADPRITGYQRQSRELYDQLVAPVAGMLTAKVVIVPHGVLHYLPFNALLDAGGSYVIDKHTLRMLPAAGIMCYLKPAAGPWSTPALILGNPERNDRRLALQHAGEEALAIARLLPGATVLVGNEATSSAITRNEERFRFLHIAAHGLFDPQEPLHSALLLATEPGNDGLLRASDLYRLRLKAELVTLSACETALSTVAKGDDLLGFTRGLLYAGARSIVASLWKVDDLATRDLM
ncbi:MAG TPA: CHAT domain-containing protein, partial [Desulfuromonadaceae bacterium]